MQSNSIPLDEYLNAAGSSGVLSEAELDQQLLGNRIPDPVGGLTPSGAKTLSEVFEEIAESGEREDEVQVAIKVASHGVKVLSPLLAAIGNWVDPKDSIAVEKIMNGTLSRLRRDAATVISAFAVDPSDAPAWLTSQVSGMIMPILVNAIARNNGVMLEPGASTYLEPMIALATTAKEVGLGYYFSPTDTRWQLLQALTSATTDVMMEFQKFSYFHSDSAGVAQYVSDYLRDRVIDTTLADLTERWQLNDSEAAYLGVSLLSSSGKMLASCWSTGHEIAIATVRDLPVSSQREMLVNGYPLDGIFTEFERLYQGIEISAESALRSISPMREIVPSVNKSHDAKLG